MTNFTCFLVANLADSTFFSPSGLGGFMWMVACIGAFSTDCLAKQRKVYEEFGVFSPAMIDGIMSQLKAFKDKTLRAQVTKSKTAMQKLVKTYFYCG